MLPIVRHRFLNCLLYLFAVIILIVSNGYASELVVEGSGYGADKKEAFFAAATDAVWKVLYEEIGVGADEKEEEIKDWVQTRLKKDRNKYISKHRFKSIKKDPVLDEIQLSADFTVKTNRIAQLAKEVFKDVVQSDSAPTAENPTIMFLFKDKQLEAAFTQEFVDKGLNVLSHEQAIARFEAARKEARQRAEEEKQVLEWLGAVKEDNGESLARERAVKMANYLKADYFVKGSYDISKKGQDKMGRLQVMFNLEDFEVHSSKGQGQIVAKVQNMVYADGTTYDEAIKLSKKKAAVVLVKEAFQQIITNWNSK